MSIDSRRHTDGRQRQLHFACGKSSDAIASYGEHLIALDRFVHLHELLLLLFWILYDADILISHWSVSNGDACVAFIKRNLHTNIKHTMKWCDVWITQQLAREWLAKRWRFSQRYQKMLKCVVNGRPECLAPFLNLLWLTDVCCVCDKEKWFGFAHIWRPHRLQQTIDIRFSQSSCRPQIIRLNSAIFFTTKYLTIEKYYLFFSSKWALFNAPLMEMMADAIDHKTHKLNWTLWRCVIV